MALIYFDSSALVKLVVAEQAWHEYWAAVRPKPGTTCPQQAADPAPANTAPCPFTLTRGLQTAAA
jgi:hypothetical protein